jgi:hypothetical protein
MDVQIQIYSDIPEITRGGGNAAGPYSEGMKALKAPQGKGDNKKYQGFFVPAEAPEGLTDAGEIEKAQRDTCRKLSNSFAGIARRIMKGDASYKFAFRTLREVEGGPLGVRVYRIEA